MKEVKLQSGKVLHITMAPFADSKALYQAILEEAKGLSLDPNAEIDANLFKDLFCTALSSKKIEECLWKCMERVTYNKLKVTQDTFEDVEARGDYIEACVEVAKENVFPFMKSLYAKYGRALDLKVKIPA